MMKWIVLSLLFFSIFLSTSLAGAFQFSMPLEGEKIFAGSIMKVRIEPGDIDPLFGVMLVISPAGIIEAKLDSLRPFEWSIKIPDNFHGLLRLQAIGRRYRPIPNPPGATLTVLVVLPAISISNPPNPLLELP